MCSMLTHAYIHTYLRGTWYQFIQMYHSQKIHPSNETTKYTHLPYPPEDLSGAVVGEEGQIQAADMDAARTATMEGREMERL